MRSSSTALLRFVWLGVILVSCGKPRQAPREAGAATPAGAGPRAQTASVRAAAATPAASPPADPGYLGPDACRECHTETFEAAKTTSHHLDSQIATPATVWGAFEGEESVLETGRPDLALEMQRRSDGLYQVAVLDRRGRRQEVMAKRFDIVVGAKNAQTSMFWRDEVSQPGRRGNGLFQLPATHFKKTRTWIYSPGMQKGELRFDRFIHPRCLECHSTWFDLIDYKLEGGFGGIGADVDPTTFLLGITCEKCHGPGREHVAYHRAHPEVREAHGLVGIKGLDAERQIEVCGLCHSGANQVNFKQPPFSFRPGARLSDYLVFSAAAASETGKDPEVHSNQVELLKSSRCFQGSEGMTCTTCHDVHRNERDDHVTFSKRCLSCHELADCGARPRPPGPGGDSCIDCHMPVRTSTAVTLQSGEQPLVFPVRTHLIKVYPGGAAPSARP